MFKEYWNKVHKKYENNKINYDNWLEDYKDTLNKCESTVLDLGCGTGNDTLYLKERGFSVIACDYSEVALSSVKKNIKNVETRCIDISKQLPFENETFDLIIADLSLHYFDTETTKSILKEIKRILKQGGTLLARVNSIFDINYGAGQGKKIEENFYFVEGYNKRFFSIEDAEKFFSIIGDVFVKEAHMLRYTKPKKVIEVKAVKNLTL